MEQIKRPKPAVYVFNKQGSALPNALHPQKTATFYKILYLFTEYKSNAISSANFHIFCAKRNRRFLLPAVLHTTCCLTL